MNQPIGSNLAQRVLGGFIWALTLFSMNAIALITTDSALAAPAKSCADCAFVPTLWKAKEQTDKAMLKYSELAEKWRQFAVSRGDFWLETVQVGGVNHTVAKSVIALNSLPPATASQALAEIRQKIAEFKQDEAALLQQLLQETNDPGLKAGGFAELAALLSDADYIDCSFDPAKPVKVTEAAPCGGLNDTLLGIEKTRLQKCQSVRGSDAKPLRLPTPFGLALDRRFQFLNAAQALGQEADRALKEPIAINPGPGQWVVPGTEVARTMISLKNPIPKPYSLHIVLHSDDSAATPPSSQLLVPGEKDREITIATKAVADRTPAKISVKCFDEGVWNSRDLVVLPPTLMLIRGPAKLSSGQSGEGVAIIDYPAPEGGLTISLSTNAPLRVTPPTVTIEEGKKEAKFIVAADKVKNEVRQSVSGRLGTTSRSSSVTITP